MWENWTIHLADWHFYWLSLTHVVYQCLFFCGGVRHDGGARACLPRLVHLIRRSSIRTFSAQTVYFHIYDLRSLCATFHNMLKTLLQKNTILTACRNIVIWVSAVRQVSRPSNFALLLLQLYSSNIYKKLLKGFNCHHRTVYFNYILS